MEWKSSGFLFRAGTYLLLISSSRPRISDRIWEPRQGVYIIPSNIINMNTQETDEPRCWLKHVTTITIIALQPSFKPSMNFAHTSLYQYQTKHVGQSGPTIETYNSYDPYLTYRKAFYTSVTVVPAVTSNQGREIKIHHQSSSLVMKNVSSVP